MTIGSSACHNAGRVSELMETTAIVFNKPGSLGLQSLQLEEPGPDDVVVESLWSGISTGTEKRFFDGSMPAFPGMTYPLVPGYETVGRVVQAGPDCGMAPGALVFVPGARCYREAAGLFGATASHIVVAAKRVTPIGEEMMETGTLLSLAATAHHALALPGAEPPRLVIGHGLLGRLIARIMLALGHPAPVVWETNAARRTGADGYEVVEPLDSDPRRFETVLDASGDPQIVDAAVRVLKPGGEITLAGFYGDKLSFHFAPAFMREARFRVSAEFTPPDVAAVLGLVRSGKLSLQRLISHRMPAASAKSAYATAFLDPGCLKMVLNWRTLQ